ncbi:MAG: hypothetical protein HQ512_01225 [Rhodospirillales bacterium]|nr:hypothetical protein [Rhodospirillales bacterium]
MEIQERRVLLVTGENPDASLDYIAGLQGTLQAFGHGMPTRITVQYVPDRLIIAPPAFGRYLETLATLEWNSLEELTTAILSDFTNELVARWVRVAIIAPEEAYPGVGAHEVMIEDHQPDWDNPALLSRLPTN